MTQTNLETRTIEIKSGNQILNLKIEIVESENLYLPFEVGQMIKSLANITGQPVIVKQIETTTILPDKDESEK